MLKFACQSWTQWTGTLQEITPYSIIIVRCIEVRDVDKKVRRLRRASVYLGRIFTHFYASMTGTDSLAWFELGKPPINMPIIVV